MLLKYETANELCMIKIKLIIYNLIKKLKFIVIGGSSFEYISKNYIEIIKKDFIKRNIPNYIIDGYKVYSQNDEDGIIDSIFKEIGIKNKTFIEIGIGNGLENNTHYLLLQNWKGIWFDLNKKNVLKINKIIPKNNKLLVCNKMITPENINETIKDSLYFFQNKGIDSVDFFSIDIDTYDIQCVKKIEIIRPRLICIEYNSKFPPTIDITIEYKENLEWHHDDYMGSSLFHINKELNKMNYKLISTNITGSNAFFVRDDLYKKCRTFGQNIKDLYMPENYNLYSFVSGHKPSFKFLYDKIKE